MTCIKFANIEVNLSPPDAITAIWNFLEPALRIWAGKLKDGSETKLIVMRVIDSGEKVIEELKKILDGKPSIYLHSMHQ